MVARWVKMAEVVALDGRCGGERLVGRGCAVGVSVGLGVERGWGVAARQLGTWSLQRGAKWTEE